MTSKELQDKYLSVYYSLKNIGFKNKLILLVLTIPSVLLMYRFLDVKFNRYHLGKLIPHNQIVIITICIGIALILTILTIKSFSFIHTQNAKSFKHYFKTDLFDCVRSEIPEVNDYKYNQKIHPKVFYNSNLFKSKFSDYVGDDWIRGQINNIPFEMCELHVFNLFENIFSGIFTRIGIYDASISITEILVHNKIHISDFEEKYHAKILVSQNQNGMFIAIKMNGIFFEANNPQTIKSTDANVKMLKDIIDLIKRIIGANK